MTSRRQPSLSRLLLPCLLFLLLAAGCSPQVVPQADPQGVVAVAGFTSPRFNWELMAGYLPDENLPVSQDILLKLDAVLMQELNTRNPQLKAVPPAITRQCQEIVVFKRIGEGRESAFQYWINVGKCLPCDYLLVPQALRWQNRQGNAAGVTVPAGVTLDLYLLDIKTGRVAARYLFDKTQTPLSANFLNAGEFFDRGGKWVMAMQLAKEGIDRAMKEFGL